MVVHALAWQITDAGCQNSLMKTKTHHGHSGHNGHSSHPKIISEGWRSSCTSFSIDLACEITQAAFLFCLTPECNCYPATAAGWVQAPANITQEGLVSKQGLQRLLSLPESPAGIACHPCQMIRSGQLAVEVD